MVSYEEIVDRLDEMTVVVVAAHPDDVERVRRACEGLPLHRVVASRFVPRGTVVRIDRAALSAAGKTEGA